jgi:hypothetical protein
MRLARTAPALDPNRNIRLMPPAPDRAELETSANSDVVRSYYLTRAAENALGEIFADRERLYWIAGDSGTGKTHFLSYVIALEQRAGRPPARGGRQIVCSLEVMGDPSAAEINRYVATAIAHRASDAHNVTRIFAGNVKDALAQAARVGIERVVVGIDFGAGDPSKSREFFQNISVGRECAASAALTIIAAARSPAAVGAANLHVAATDDRESMLAAITRARIFGDKPDRFSLSANAIAQSSEDSRAIFPFHRTTFEILAALFRNVTVAGKSHAASRLIERWIERWSEREATRDRLIVPADLMSDDQVAALIDNRGGAELMRARAIFAAQSIEFDPSVRKIAQELFDTLALTRAAGLGDSSEAATLSANLPSLVRFGDESARCAAVSGVASRIAFATNGLLRFEGDRIFFAPGNVGDVARFNAVLSLALRFSRKFERARDAEQAARMIDLLDVAMRECSLGAMRPRAVLESTAARLRCSMPARCVEAIDRYLELAATGARGVLEIGADLKVHRDANLTFDEYERVSHIAALCPRVSTMLEFLRATRLRGSLGNLEESNLAAEASLIGDAIESRLFELNGSELEALEARFYRFRWSYIPAYREAHARRMRESSHAASIFERVRAIAQTAQRLDFIAILGPPCADRLRQRFEHLAAIIRTCDRHLSRLESSLARCDRCGFVLGSDSPIEDAEALLGEARSIVGAKVHRAVAIVGNARYRNAAREVEARGIVAILSAARPENLEAILSDRIVKLVEDLIEESVATLAQDSSDSTDDGSGGAVCLGAARRKRTGVGLAPRLESQPIEYPEIDIANDLEHPK